MFKQYLSVPPDIFKAFRDLPVRAKRNFNREIRNAIQPEAQRKAIELLGKAPSAVKRPFVFGTARSRRAFFATRGFGRGIPTQRSGAILKAWVVEVTRQGQTTFILLTNTQPYAKYVYGLPPIQRQIPGHQRTGWKVDRTAVTALQAYIVDLLVEAWYRALTAAMKGKG